MLDIGSSGSHNAVISLKAIRKHISLVNDKGPGAQPTTCIERQSQQWHRDQLFPLINTEHGYVIAQQSTGRAYSALNNITCDTAFMLSHHQRGTPSISPYYYSCPMIFTHILVPPVVYLNTHAECVARLFAGQALGRPLHVMHVMCGITRTAWA